MVDIRHRCILPLGMTHFLSLFLLLSLPYFLLIGLKFCYETLSLFLFLSLSNILRLLFFFSSLSLSPSAKYCLNIYFFPYNIVAVTTGCLSRSYCYKEGPMYTRKIKGMFISIQFKRDIRQIISSTK